MKEFLFFIISACLGALIAIGVRTDIISIVIIASICLIAVIGYVIVIRDGLNKIKNDLIDLKKYVQSLRR